MAANVVLAVLVEHSGYSSLDGLAEAINSRAWTAHGVKLGYDHTTIKRWLAGGSCQYPQVVADVLSAAWAIPISAHAIWPKLRDGAPPAPVHLLPAVAARTLEELRTYVGVDMLTRREVLADAVRLTAGASLTEPLSRWLITPAVGLPARTAGTRIGTEAVTAIEQVSGFFASSDAQAGGGIAREAAAGQLRYAVDLAIDASYTQAVGDRLLSAIAELSGLVGWASHDVGMNGPSQRYFLFGLQAAHASADPRARMIGVGLLADLARVATATGDYVAGTQLVTLALDRLPKGQHASAAAMLWTLKAAALAPQGRAAHPEMRAAIACAFDLYADDAGEEDPDHGAMSYTSVAELSGVSAVALRDAAYADPDRAASHAAASIEYTQTALTERPEGYDRSRLFDLIGLARNGFLLKEPEQAAHDGQKAIATAAHVVSGSARAMNRVKQLAADCRQWQHISAVRELGESLRGLVG